MSAFLMQARSSTTGALVSWMSSTPDFAASSFPGPGLAEYVAVSGRFQPEIAGGSINLPANPSENNFFAVGAAGNLDYLNSTQATALLEEFTSASSGVAPASGGGSTNFLRADGEWAAPAATPTGSAGGDLTGTYPNPAIAANAVSLSKLAQVGTDSLLGRDTAGTGNVESIGLDASLQMSGLQILQRAALTGDVTASAGSNTTSIANDAVTNAKLANMTQATIKGRASGAGTGDPTDLTPAQARTVIGVTRVSAFGASNTWDKDATSVWIDFVLVGGGAGGGAVGGGVGGGGGGPGAILILGFPANEVPEDLTITIGAAGVAGSNGGNTTVSGVGFSLIAPGGLAGVGGSSGGAGGTAGAHGLNSAVSGGNGGASSGTDGSLNPFGGLVGSGATGGPGTGGGGYGAGGGGGAGASDGGGGGAGGYAGTPAAGNGTATDGGAGTSGFVVIIERRG